MNMFNVKKMMEEAEKKKQQQQQQRPGPETADEDREEDDEEGTAEEEAEAEGTRGKGLRMRLTDRDRQLMGILATAPGSQIAGWHIWVRKDLWDPTTQWLKYSVLVEADNVPNDGGYIDNVTVTVDFEIIGTTGVNSSISRFTQSCSGSTPACSTTGSYFLGFSPPTYVGHAISRIDINSSSLLTLNTIEADATSWVQGRYLNVTTGCVLADSASNSSTTCNLGLIGLKGSAAELGNLTKPMSVSNASVYTTLLFTQPESPMPRENLCGLQKFHLDFGLNNDRRIWKMSTGATSADCDSNGFNAWTGAWRAFLGDVMNSTNAVPFNGSGVLWGGQLK